MIDLQTLKLTAKPNQFFVAPAGWSTATPHRLSPVFVCTREELSARLRAIAAQAERCEIVKVRSTEGPADNFAFEAVQRSKFFKFPDTITMRILPGPDDTTSQVAIYSRARYGYRDFGVNKKRIDAWIAQLETDPKG